MDPVEVVLTSLRETLAELGTEELKVTSLSVAVLADRLLAHGAVLGGVSREPEGLAEEDLEFAIKHPEQKGGLFVVRALHRPTSLAVYKSHSSLIQAKAGAIEGLTSIVRQKQATA